MARQSVIVHSRLLVLLQSLCVLLAIQPAYAQVVLPPNFISPDVPHDVTTGPNTSIQDLAIFAWSEFIALNWVAMDPATTGMRGRPACSPCSGSEVNADFLSIKPDSDGSFPLLVWHTYQHKNELFPANGHTAPSFDSAAPLYIYSSPPGQGTSFPLQVTQTATSASFTLFNNLDETSEIGSCQMFAHDTTLRVAYEAKANRALFDYVNNNGLTACTSGTSATCPTLTAARNKTAAALAQFGGICSADKSIVSLPCGDAQTLGDGGEGAIEVKAAWRQLTPQEVQSGRFFMRKVIYYTGTGGTPSVFNNAVYGLVGLHIIHKTKTFPAFVFATWEQVDNYDDATDQNTEDLTFIETGSTTPSPVTRMHPIHSQIPPVNDAVHAAFTAQDPTTVWQYYKLVGVQATPPPSPIPPSTDRTDAAAYFYLSNIVVETDPFLQNFSSGAVLNGNTFNVGGCQGCHGLAGQAAGGDMSVLVADAPRNSAGPPETIDNAPAESLQSFQLRTNDFDGDFLPDNLDECAGSDLSPTVVIGSCDSGVPNALLLNGCSISDLIAECAAGASKHRREEEHNTHRRAEEHNARRRAEEHDADRREEEHNARFFASCVSAVIKGLDPGLITASQKGAIRRCAAKGHIF